MTISLPGIPSTVQAGVINVEGLGQVPIIDMPRFDERQCCGYVLRYLAGDIEGQPAEYTACKAYKGRQCRMQGGGALCAFHEADNAAIWRRAANWRLLIEPSGAEFVTTVVSAPAMAAAYNARIVGLVEVR